MDVPVLTRELSWVGFEIERAEYLNRTDFPQDLRLDGRESVGIVGRKSNALP